MSDLSFLPALPLVSNQIVWFGVLLLAGFTLNLFFDVEPLHAATAAAIGIATSPAVVMRITADLGAQGQVTQRALLLTALNSSVAVLALTALVPWLYLEYGGTW